ncbi:MAG: FAD-dependent oxidoreductase, partial [Longispora sp.]|nr:FAD-dependent oxidoreductase [Longispora sp. (in: high G+C Gram-positive bacteria)]
AVLTATLGGALVVATGAATVAGTPVPAHAGQAVKAEKKQKMLTESITENAQRRAVVIGGGITGTSLSWLLDGEYDVTLLEAKKQLGGHISTIDVDGHAIDVGAQFFAKTTHPQYWKLMELLDMPVSNLPLDLTFSQLGAATPSVMTPHVKRPVKTYRDFVRNKGELLAMVTFILKARELQRVDDRDMTVEEFVEGLDVKRRYKDTVLYPLSSLEFGCPIDVVKGLSAWAATLFLARSFPLETLKVAAHPRELLRPFEYNSVTGGLRTVIDTLSYNFGAASSSVHAYTNAKVELVERRGEEYLVHVNGNAFIADEVVMAIPPYAAAPLLRKLGEGALVAVSEEMEYFDTEMAIHTDPMYMPKKRYRSAYNVIYDGNACEGTIWYGAFSDAVNVHKSWVTHRAERPQEIVHSQWFKHPCITPEFFRNGATLSGYHKRGLSFAGGFTVAVVSQEHGLISAMNTARRLAPNAPNLNRLENWR